MPSVGYDEKRRGGLLKRRSARWPRSLLPPLGVDQDATSTLYSLGLIIRTDVSWHADEHGNQQAAVGGIF